MAELKLFGRWDTKDVKVEDMGLRKYVNVSPVMVPRTSGRFTKIPSRKSRMNIIERLINKLMVPGHKGRKHKVTSGRCCGNTAGILRAMEEAFAIIEGKAKQNPLQVVVRAVENSAPLEEIAAYRLGGIIARKSVVIAPQRRLDLALRHLSQGIYASTFGKKKTLAQAIADEVMLAASNDKASSAVSERARLEREADGAR